MKPYAFWIGLIYLVVVALTGCDLVTSSVAPKPTQTSTAVTVMPTAVATSTPTPTPNPIYRPLLDAAQEWSAAVGGEQWGPPRGKGFVVQLVDCEGPRIKIIDPSTKGPAYIDRDVVEVPTGFCSHLSDSDGPKTVFIMFAGPAVYPHTAPVLKNVARLLRLSSKPGDTFVINWVNGLNIIPTLQIPIPRIVQNTPTLTVTPCGPYNGGCHAVRATATAQAAATEPKTDAGQDAEGKQTIEEDAQALETLSLNLSDAPTSSDLLPALSRAQLLLRDTTGPKWLLIAAPQEPPSDDELSHLQVSGTFVRFIAACPDPIRCSQWQHTWQTWAATTNADVGFYDELVDLSEKVH